MQKGAFWVSDPKDRKCEGGGFNWTVAVSAENENTTIQALRDTLEALERDYDTTRQEDARILDDHYDNRVPLSPLRFNAVLLRLREKTLIAGTVDWLDARRANLSNLTYQIEEVRAAEEARKLRVEERKAWRAKVRKELAETPLVATVPINLGPTAGGEVKFTWKEGESLEDAALAFGVKHGLTYDGLDQLKAAARPRIPEQKRVEFFMPVVLADGIRAAIRVNVGENATEVADRFCAKHGVEEEATEAILAQVQDRYAKRMNRSLLMTFPVDAPDGRKLNFDVRQGEQHDLIRLVQDWALALNLNINVEQLANVAHGKLPGQIMELPVDISMQRRIVLRVRQGDQPRELVEAFCEFFALDPATAGTNILTAVRRGLNPGALVVPAEPYKTKEELEAEENENSEKDEEEGEEDHGAAEGSD